MLDARVAKLFLQSGWGVAKPEILKVLDIADFSM